MSTTTNFTVRMDSDIKKQYESLYNELAPNNETIAAMLEAERITRDSSVKHYSDVEEALRELKR